MSFHLPPPVNTTDIKWAANAWDRAKGLEPSLTSYGFGTCGQYEDQFKGGPNHRQLLMIAACGFFLYDLPKVKAHRKSFGSYALKHGVEKWCGFYIMEGALIAAAVTLGVSLKRYTGKHGAFVGIALRPTIQRLSERLQKQPPGLQIDD